MARARLGAWSGRDRGDDHRPHPVATQRVRHRQSVGAAVTSGNPFDPPSLHERIEPFYSTRIGFIIEFCRIMQDFGHGWSAGRNIEPVGVESSAVAIHPESGRRVILWQSGLIEWLGEIESEIQNIADHVLAWEIQRAGPFEVMKPPEP